MRKLLTFFVAMLVTGNMFAGGLVTNTNQSAAWVRLPSRNASTGIDAAFFNPAGLMKLENGFHFSLSNQTISQSRTVTNSYSGPATTVPAPVAPVHWGLNNPSFDGEVFAPFFPSIYAVYKMDKFAFSLGFNPVGGGGGAIYETGLPSFEMSPSDLVPSLNAKAGVKGYRLDAYLKGTSTFLGFQGGVSYKINDIISVALGLRYVTAKNTYNGHLQDIQLDMGGGSWLPANTVLTGLATNLTSITQIPAGLAPAISLGFGGATLDQLVTAQKMSASDKDKIVAGLLAIGVPSANIPLMNIATISGTVTGATPTLKDQIATITANASLVSNQSADVAQTGSGITPIFSINISPAENLNIGIKYEMMTKLELTNETKQDLTVGYGTKAGFVTLPTPSVIPDMTLPVTMFPNGEKTRNDMPAVLTVGLDYRFSTSLKLSLGSNYYFDKSADYGHKINGVHVANKDIIAQNGLSFSGGLEFNISEKFLISGGYSWANKGVNSKYQSDLTFGQSTNTFGAGAAYSFSKKIQLNIGAGYTGYVKDSKTVDHTFSSTGEVIHTNEAYEKGTFLAGIGVDISF
jgi:long-chain fatty acid transport protein